MPRDSKLEVAAINIRIPEDKDRDYTALIQAMADLRQGVRVYGETYLAISLFDAATGVGVFSKYTEIDIDGDWFDLEDFGTATPDKLEDISIPENLRPNHSSFYFRLDPDLHVIAFATYASSKGMSARSVGKYFQDVLWDLDIIDRFGWVESDVVKSYGEVERLLGLSELKELHLVINRPNSDDVGDTLADIIERRLKEQNASSYEEALLAKGKNDLKPNERTRQLAQVAAENGEVRAKSIVNGVLTTQTTEEQPLIERASYKPEDHSEISIFQALALRVFGQIRAARAALK